MCGKHLPLATAADAERLQKPGRAAPVGIAEVEPAPHAHDDERHKKHGQLRKLLHFGDLLPAHEIAREEVGQEHECAAEREEFAHVGVNADQQRHGEGDGENEAYLRQGADEYLPEEHTHEIPVKEGRREEIRRAASENKHEQTGEDEVGDEKFPDGRGVALVGLFGEIAGEEAEARHGYHARPDDHQLHGTVDGAAGLGEHMLADHIE